MDGACAGGRGATDLLALMVSVVRIAVPVPLAQAFDYSVPEGGVAPAVGTRVRVRFANRILVGVCLALDPEDAFAETKPLVEVLDSTSVLTEDILRLGHWLAAYYHHPIGEVFAAMLPNAALQGTPLTWRPQQVWLRVRGAAVDLAQAPRQRALLEFLDRNGGWASGAAIRAAGFTSAMIAALVKKGALKAGERPYELEQPLPLTADQHRVVEDYRRSLRGFSANLLEGVTGSGKTEVYLQVIGEVLAGGGQALVLVPEIVLTPQTVARFQRRYGAVDVLHSGLNDQERLTAWLRCRDGAARILIGTRSAVFTPFKKLGLIVVDEEHDASFKQQDRLRYSARDVAVKRAKDLNIPLLLGSATPSLESLENFRCRRYRRQVLPRRATGAALPRLQVLDIRGHRLQDGLSQPLLLRMARHLDAGGQVLVFLNRRGYAPIYLCAACGWQAVCSACDARLTLHLGRRLLACHHCGAEQPPPSVCPACGRADLTAVGTGTERAEAALKARFPDFSLIRIDRDTTRTQRRLEMQLAKIRRGEPGILVGTQMLAKGHHFPNITLVAAINADAGFLSADFKAPERTAQLLIQVAGRAGRANRPGHVWIQTLQPDNPALQRLVEAGYAGFADHELANRHRLGLPPARHMALVRAAAADPETPRRFLKQLKALLIGKPSADGAPRPHRHAALASRPGAVAPAVQQGRLGAGGGAAKAGSVAKPPRAGKQPDPLEVLGPAPAPMPRLANLHRQQLMLLAASRNALHGALDGLAEVRAPRELRWNIDVDPLDAF